MVTTPLGYLASAQRVAVLAARLPKRFHRSVEVGIERGQVQAIAVDDVKQRVVFADVQLICRFLGQDQAQRVADLSDLDRGGHGLEFRVSLGGV